MAGRTLHVLAENSEFGVTTLSQEWFGIIYTGFRNFTKFTDQLETLNAGAIRWPGGTLSEKRADVYGLDVPDLFDATDLYSHNEDRTRAGLTEMLGYSVANELPFTLIIPTMRYADDIGRGTEHLMSFLTELLSGEFGTLPTKLTLEIGNEYSGSEIFVKNPELYGQIATEFAEIIDNYRVSYGVNVDIAVQMGKDYDADTAIRGSFSQHGLQSIDSLVFHSLPISVKNLVSPMTDGPIEDVGDTRFERFSNYSSAWNTEILSAGGEEASLYLSAFNSGGSASDKDVNKLKWFDYGLRSASVLIETVAGYTSIGVDRAAIWGVGVTNPNFISKFSDGALTLSHSGVMYKLMAKTLPGMKLLGTFEPQSREDAFIHYSFGDGEKVASYISVNDLRSSGSSQEIAFDGVDNFRIRSSIRLGTELDSDFQGQLSEDEARLHEIPTITDLYPSFTSAGLLVEFTQNYQVVEVIVQIGIGLSATDDSDWISGTTVDDIIHGLMGNDFLQGRSGDDILIGDEGDDHLLGGGGKDTLQGGDGENTLIGGEGADTFVFTEINAHDTIIDFELNVDKLDFTNLVGQTAFLTLVHNGNAMSSMRDSGSHQFGRVSISSQQVGTDVLFSITHSGDSSSQAYITLQNIDIADLSFHDFLF